MCQNLQQQRFDDGKIRKCGVLLGIVSSI